MYTPYILAGLITLLVMLIGYILFVPKNETGLTTEVDKDTNPLLKVINTIGNDFYKSLPKGFINEGRQKKPHPRIEALIVRAGNPWNLTAEEFNTIQYVAAFIGFLSSWVVWYGLSTVISLPWFVVVPLVTLFAFMIPRIKYNEQAKNRDLEFKRQLPEALDLLIISLSGGRTFPHALREIMPTMQEGVLKEEFTTVIKGLDTGKTLKEVLDDFATRAPNEGIETFIRSVQSATEVNASLVDTLAARAAASRQEFFALIHEKTAKLESKIFMILTPTMMPAVLIVAVAPSIVSMLETLGS